MVDRCWTPSNGNVFHKGHHRGEKFRTRYSVLFKVCCKKPSDLYALAINRKANKIARKDYAKVAVL